MPHGGKVPAAVARHIQAHERAVRAVKSRQPLPARQKIELVLGILLVLTGLILGGRALARYIREERKRAEVVRDRGTRTGREPAPLVNARWAVVLIVAVLSGSNIFFRVGSKVVFV